MAQIIRGTTPTLEFTFSDVTVGSITKAILTAKQDSTIMIEKDLEAATIGAKSISWTLDQSDTLKLKSGRAADISTNRAIMSSYIAPAVKLRSRQSR
jgi:hypothetical protein